ncbi:MAG: hypothetical protein ACRD0N_14995 [Acidimicrobiales bacterium]
MRLRFCPGAFAVGEAAVWVGDSAFPVLVRIDPRSNRVVAMVPQLADDSDYPVLDLAAGCGGIWSGDAGGRILRRDGATAEVRATIPLEEEPDPWAWAGCSVAVGAGAVWVTGVFKGSVTRIDPVSDTVATTIPVGSSLDSVAVAYGSVWVLDGVEGDLARIDPAAGRVVARLSLGVRPAQVSVGEGGVWVSVDCGRHGPRIVRIDPATSRRVSTLGLGEMPESFDVGEGALWEVTTTSAKSEASEAVRSTVRKIDPTTYATLATVPVEGLVTRLRHGEGALWATVWRSDEQAGRVIRIDPVGARVAAVIELPDLTVVPVHADT